MVIVIPFEATQRLMQMAQTHRVNLPVPLSSPCAGYLSPDEMDTILQTLVPFSATDAATTRLVSDLQDYREQRLPVLPCGT